MHDSLCQRRHFQHVSRRVNALIAGCLPENPRLVLPPAERWPHGVAAASPFLGGHPCQSVVARLRSVASCCLSSRPPRSPFWSLHSQPSDPTLGCTRPFHGIGMMGRGMRHRFSPSPKRPPSNLARARRLEMKETPPRTRMHWLLESRRRRLLAPALDERESCSPS